MTQFVSQVRPPSGENACSQRHEVGVMSDQTYRTSTPWPWWSSWLKNSPMPSLKAPTMGWSRIPFAPFAQ